MAGLRRTLMGEGWAVDHSRVLRLGSSGSPGSLKDDLTIYDAAYVALAELLQVSLVTADGRIKGASGTRLPLEVLCKPDTARLAVAPAGSDSPSSQLGATAIVRPLGPVKGLVADLGGACPGTPDSALARVFLPKPRQPPPASDVGPK